LQQNSTYFLERRRKEAIEGEEKIGIKNCFLLMHALFKGSFLLLKALSSLCFCHLVVTNKSCVFKAKLNCFKAN